MPSEVCAYKYLAECYVESKQPGMAKFWFDEAVKREPLLFERELLYRINLIRADSLMNAGNAALAALDLDTFLVRLERIGEGSYWSMSALYQKCGSAYRMSGDVDNAMLVWRRGIGLRESSNYYPEFMILAMAESLKNYSTTFNEDSVAALRISKPNLFPSFYGSFMNAFLGIIFSFVAWFLLGILILIPTVVTVSHENFGKTPDKLGGRTKAIILGFFLFVLLPSILVPVIFTIIFGGNSFMLASGLAAIIGILCALLDSRHRARKNNLHFATVLYSRFLPVWLIVTILLAVGFSLIVTSYGLFFLYTPFLALLLPTAFVDGSRK